MLSLNLFGLVSLTRNGEPLVGPAAQRRRLAFLALLAAAPAGGLPREKLV
jgi:DNA-binding SARP family transcriptional activator